MMDNTLRRLQLTQYEMLQEVDRFCKKHQIEYSLIYGTLIGAVRHQGCIPWDDDLDILMTRHNYNLFCDAWAKAPPEGYLLQNKENTPAFAQCFAKIRKKHTTFLENTGDNTKFHTGIFIDIFIVDRAPKNNYSLKAFRMKCLLYQLLTRECIPQKSGKMTRFVSSIVLATIRGRMRVRIRSYVFNSLMRYNEDTTCPTILISTPNSIRFLYSPDFFDTYVLLPYEDGEYPCISTWDDFLRIQYGDYMSFPPVEKRKWQHHPILIDFEHDYEELQQQTDPDRLP